MHDEFPASEPTQVPPVIVKSVALVSLSDGLMLVIAVGVWLVRVMVLLALVVPSV